MLGNPQKYRYLDACSFGSREERERERRRDEKSNSTRDIAWLDRHKM